MTTTTMLDDDHDHNDIKDHDYDDDDHDYSDIKVQWWWPPP